MEHKNGEKMEKMLSNLLIAVLVIVGLVLIFNQPIQKMLLQHKTQTYQVQHVTRKKIIQNQKVTTTFDFDQVQSISAQKVVANQFSTEQLPVIGYIVIPSVHIQLPIFKGLSNEVLLYGAGTTSPTQVMGKGNYGLASHRMFDESLLFTPLDHVKVGEKIYLTDLANMYIYEAISNEKVSPNRVDVLDEVPDTTLVTLITCGEMSGETRRVVQGKLIQTIAYNQASAKVLAIFQRS